MPPFRHYIKEVYSSLTKWQLLYPKLKAVFKTKNTIYHAPSIIYWFGTRRGLWIGITSIVLWGALTHQIYAVRMYFTQVLPQGVLDLEKKGPSYIFIENEGSGLPQEALLAADVDFSTEWQNVKSDLPAFWLQDKYAPTLNYWEEFLKTKSTKVEDRVAAVKKIAEMDMLHDFQCLQIAQASDFSTAVGLARSDITNMSLLLRPPPLPECKEPEMERRIRNILASLPERNVVDCVAYLTQHVMQRGHFYHSAGSDGYYFWSQSGIAGKGVQRVPEETMRIFYLEALLSHSRVPAHRSLIVSLGGLLLLMQIANYNSSKLDVLSLIAQILGNIALDPSLHKDLFKAGWVKILAMWMRSSHVEVSFPAARALANMDQDAFPDVLEDGVYILHPFYRVTQPEITADVVFVHGLTGGAFKTWRQRDRNPQNPVMEDDELSSKSEFEGVSFKETFKDVPVPEMPAKNLPLGEKIHLPQPVKQRSWFKILQDHSNMPQYTQSWPKDWLAVDCPIVRILAVDFDTQVSEWFQKCPVEPEKRTIVSRSNEILQRLLKAGVGKRPIIWVTHSMGGLLVKKLLITSSESSDPNVHSVWENTKGIVFFSVPHRGSLWASWGGTEFLLLLSTEVQELKYNSPQLLELHVRFQDLVEKVKLPCLSFGETKKTNLGLAVEAWFVSPYSSDPGMGNFYTVETDHINICKPVNKHSKTYLRLLEFIYENIPHSIFDTLMAPGLKTLDVDTFLDLYMMW